MKKYIEMFTDGACSGNPGPGGWGAILRYAGREKELCGGDSETTNNRMELSAGIYGLKALNRNARAVIRESYGNHAMRLYHVNGDTRLLVIRIFYGIICQIEQYLLH